MLKEYDFVFNVDIEDGKTPLKLPYNKSDDPWFVAQAFIHKHDLPQSYLDQVANFIINNSKQKNITMTNTPAEYADPFTGIYVSLYCATGPYTYKFSKSSLSHPPKKIRMQRYTFFSNFYRIFFGFYIFQDFLNVLYSRRVFNRFWLKFMHSSLKNDSVPIFSVAWDLVSSSTP